MRITALALIVVAFCTVDTTAQCTPTYTTGSSTTTRSGFDSSGYDYVLKRRVYTIDYPDDYTLSITTHGGGVGC
jgi:hypothetical protein